MTHDLIVIGAGPAGLSAAVTASKLGLSTIIIDEQAHPGGQIYRNVTRLSDEVAAILGPDYRQGLSLAQALGGSGVEIQFGTTVWNVTHDRTVTALCRERNLQFKAPQLIIATGALERASPIPGWTIPGVLNAGAAQIALKSAGSIPSGRIALAGGGPLLLLVACQLLEAGASISAIIETSPSSNFWRALPLLPQASRAPKLLAKGLRMMMQLKRAGVPCFSAAEQLKIEGGERAESLSFLSAGRHHRLKVDVVLLHHGVVPNTQISRLLGVEHDWNEAQLAWHPRRDDFFETSLAGLRIAGDGGGIAGAISAAASGRLAALGAAQAVGQLSTAQRDRQAAASLKIMRAQQHIRPFLDALYRPPQWLTAPAGDTIVCRCEEVTAEQIRESARLGSRGPNQTKFYNRCGMGPCQGRICGLPVTEILANELGVNPSSVGAYRVRAPLKPLTLGQLAAQAKPSQAGKGSTI